MIKDHWQLQEAKNKFSNIVERAQNSGPQIVTKHGKEAVVIVSIDEYKKITKPKKSLVKFFQSSPFTNEELDITRNKDIPRDIQL